jgi:hypothetical protein
MGFFLNKDLTVGKYLLQALKNIGVKEIFGIPGNLIIKFFKLVETRMSDSAPSLMSPPLVSRRSNPHEQLKNLLSLLSPMMLEG